MTESTIITVNGYEVHSWYEGITAYHINKDGKQVYHGWDIGDVVRIVGCNPFEKGMMKKFGVYEVFPDGKKFLMHTHEDLFECECWANNHNECTNALKNRWSELVIVERG